MKLKKIFAVVVAAVMAVTMNAMPAFAAPESIGVDASCSICKRTFRYYDGNTMDGTFAKTYEEYYSTNSIHAIQNTSYVYGNPEHSNQILDLYVAKYNQNVICSSCLETKINEYKTNKSTNQTGSTNVTATVSGSYTLVVPQTVAMTGTDGTGEKTATIPVCIKGDIGENQKVTVTTVAPVMKATGSADVTATVDAPKTEWNRADVIANSNEGTTSNYTVKATLTPGEWAGTATFNCTLDTTTVKTISFTIDGAAYNAEEGMTWGQWINSDYEGASHVTLSDNDVVLRDNGGTSTSSGRKINGVNDTDVIIDGEAYTLGRPSILS